MEVFRALAALCEPPGTESGRLAAALDLSSPPDEAAWSDLFLFQLYPYASVYLGDGGIGGEARDRIAGFWRALGLTPPKECDHLAVLLAFYAELGERPEADATKGEAERWRHVRHAFLWEHLLSWLPPFLLKLDRIAPAFYQAWGRLLERALAAEAERLGPPGAAPLHWRQAPELVDPRSGGAKAFLGSLLAPPASGLFLVRADLERAARDLSLALRVGERRFLLETLLGQEARGTLDWLHAEALEWGSRLEGLPGGPASLPSFWHERTRATAALLDVLRRETPAG